MDNTGAEECRESTTATSSEPYFLLRVDFLQENILFQSVRCIFPADEVRIFLFLSSSRCVSFFRRQRNHDIPRGTT